MRYELRPSAEELLRAVRRKHRGNDRLIARATEGLLLLTRTPHRYSRRIKLLSGGLYRYRHGRCRIIYEIDDDNRVVRVLRIALCDKDTYRGL